MTHSILEGYGMIRIGRIEMLDQNTFLVRIEHPEAARWTKAIYAFLIGNEIVRIGSSKGLLGGRMRAWSRDITAALCGRKSPAPSWEADAYRSALTLHGGGEVFARTATVVTTTVGTFEAYMDEESVLINRHRPRLNRHTNR